ncbi:MAG TPA: hypothetical protein VLF62_05945 [Candidatus Saccharimonadales bacterium]|nr:hypothetical protein [Candidatus Saccharimonadales bacterium]
MLILTIGVSSLSAQGVSSIAQGFQTKDRNVVSGAIVSLKDNSPNNVELATPANVQDLIGISGSKSLIELSNGVSTVQIVTSGTTSTLVSDINGDIKTGDRITASPIAGVGMKATSSGIVVGTAQANLADVTTRSQQVTDKKGKSVAVKIGVVPVQVDKVFYQAPNDETSFLPPVLTDFASSVAGHNVSPVRIVAASLLIALLFIIVTILLYSAVRSSIISIGRNPLSEQAVHKSLLEVGLTVVGVLVFTVIVVYLILTT